MNIILTQMLNESNPAVIRRCLESVKPHINHYMILDNGSSPEVIETIKEVLTGVPGELHEGIVWRGMGENRTEVHDYAREYCKKHNIDNAYHMICDADESLTWDGKLPKSDDRVPCYWGGLSDDSGFTQIRGFLLSNDYEWKWNGRVHHRLEAENWPVPDSTKYDRQAGNANIHHHADGHSWKTADGESKIVEKYRKLACIIEDEIINNPSADRFFALAKAYQMAMHTTDPKQLDTFKQRALDAFAWVCELSDSNQEIYHCMIEIAKLKDDVTMMMLAYDFRPQRPDAPYELATSLERLGKLHLASAWYLITENVIREYPKCGDTVFQDVTIRGKIKDDRKRIRQKIRQERNEEIRQGRELT